VLYTRGLALCTMVTIIHRILNISRFKSFLFYLAPLVGVFEIYGFHKSCSESGLGGQNDNMRSSGQCTLCLKCLKLVLVLKIWTLKWLYQAKCLLIYNLRVLSNDLKGGNWQCHCHIISIMHSVGLSFSENPRELLKYDIFYYTTSCVDHEAEVVVESCDIFGKTKF